MTDSSSSEFLEMIEAARQAGAQAEEAQLAARRQEQLEVANLRDKVAASIDLGREVARAIREGDGVRAIAPNVGLVWTPPHGGVVGWMLGERRNTSDAVSAWKLIPPTSATYTYRAEANSPETNGLALGVTGTFYTYDNRSVITGSLNSYAVFQRKLAITGWDTEYVQPGEQAVQNNLSAIRYGLNSFIRNTEL